MVVKIIHVFIYIDKIFKVLDTSLYKERVKTVGTIKCFIHKAYILATTFSSFARAYSE